MAKVKPANVAAEVRELELRLSSMETVQIMLHETQVEQLAKAEKLRKLAIAAVRYPISVSAINKLEAFLSGLQPFYKNPGPMPAAMKKLLARRRKAGR